MFAPKEGLAFLLKDTQKEIELVNAQILARMQSDVPLIPQLAGYLINSGGKRIRPILTIASAKLCGYNQGQRHIALAACVEFIHTATLLHDDVVDESDQRRGKETANNIWGNQASVLVGDFLFSRSFELMTEDGSLDVLRVLSKASAIIAEGEVAQLQAASNLETTIDDYMTIIHGKTAALFAAATEVGAIVAEQSLENKEALRLYGLNLGIAFQIADDILDWSANAEELGKNTGDDFREGKITLPVILAYAASNDEEKSFWQRCLGDLEQHEGDLETAKKIIAKYDILEKCHKQALDIANQAGQHLAHFDDTELRHALQALAIYSVERNT